MWNKDEELYYAANLLYQCRCDWSDAKQVRNWIQESTQYLPKDIAENIDDDYIQAAQEDGRTTRDFSPNYEENLGLVDSKNVRQDFKVFIEKTFEFHLELR